MGGLGLAARGLIAAALLSAVAAAGPASAQEVASCSAPALPKVRTSLYFGLSRPNGGPAVTELEWQVFLRDEITPRFPDGLTVLDGRGQWRGASGRIDQEPSKVVFLTHADSPVARGSIAAIVAAYRKAFDQEAVLWESDRICAAF
jgi:hypothetical protein